MIKRIGNSSTTQPYQRPTACINFYRKGNKTEQRGHGKQTDTDKQLPGVGISIGLTRLFYVLNEQRMLNEERVMAPADVMIVPMTDDLEAAVRLATELRAQNIRVQLYAEQKKFKAKIQYADKLHIPYVVFLGEDEIAAGTVSLKDLRTGDQVTVPAQDAAARILADIELRGQGTILK